MLSCGGFIVCCTGGRGGGDGGANADFIGDAFDDL